MNPPFTQNYVWQDFVSAVTALLTVDAARVGSGIENFRTAIIRQAVIHLQTVIDQYRIGHETVYTPGDLITEGAASRGVKPPQSVIRTVHLVKTCVDGQGDGKAVRWDTDPWPWESAHALVHGKIAVNNGRGLFCIDPQGYTFYVYPEVFDEWLLSVKWDGLKLDFGNTDETPFDEATVGAVASYVKAQIALEVERESGVQLYNTHMLNFTKQIPLLYVREREKSQMKVESK